ncbi:MAG TPA: carboxypeptidase regulatory-like domain-containing protein, partial [Longimicrobiales bacterium]|nr:carboxypeptidase regulatory-like domain-containing protein [Longimicrobiales bacterium]
MSRSLVSTAVLALGVVTVLSLSGPSPAQAQAAGTIQGLVTARTGPLPGIEIRVGGTTLYGVTGADGRYRIQSVPPGSYTIQASSIGYA